MLHEYHVIWHSFRYYSRLSVTAVGLGTYYPRIRPSTCIWFNNAYCMFRSYFNYLYVLIYVFVICEILRILRMSLPYNEWSVACSLCRIYIFVVKCIIITRFFIACAALWWKSMIFIVLSSLETVHDTVQYRCCIFSLLYHLLRIRLKRRNPFRVQEIQKVHCKCTM
jgi:hypothetical protein